MREGAKSNNRIIHLDLLRILSVFGVMLLHVSASKWRAVPVDSYAWGCLNFYESISRYCVPAFVMISGMFFLKRDIPIKQLYRRNIPRLVIAFAFWSLIYTLLPYITGLQPSFKVTRFLKDFILGPTHLWFLYMICGLYVITPFLRIIASDRRLARYFLILWFLTGVCLRTLTALPLFGNIATDLEGKLSLYFPAGYSGYFVLGDYLSKTKLKARTELLIYALGALAVAFTAFSTKYLSLLTDRYNSAFYGFLSPNIMMQTIALFVLSQTRVSKIRFPERAARAITHISACSFGMYLIHGIFQLTLYEFGLDALRFDPLFSVPLLSICVFLLSYLSTALLRSIPFVRKHLM